MKINLFMFLKDDNGAPLAEYALLLSLIVIVVVGTLTPLGPMIRDLFGPLATSLGSS